MTSYIIRWYQGLRRLRRLNIIVGYIVAINSNDETNHANIVFTRNDECIIANCSGQKRKVFGYFWQSLNGHIYLTYHTLCKLWTLSQLKRVFKYVCFLSKIVLIIESFKNSLLSYTMYLYDLLGISFIEYKSITFTVYNTIMCNVVLVPIW